MNFENKVSVLGVCLTFAALLGGCDGPSTYIHHDLESKVQRESIVGSGKDSPVSLVGEKFFRETRFSQYFFSKGFKKYNELPGRGDDVVENLETLEGMYANPYKGQSISCASCHFVDQAKTIKNFGVRAYTDASRRSRIPDRGDGQNRTARNSLNMVATSIKDGMFLHNDGEFVLPEDLVRTSYLGRNMGWLPQEEDIAIHHMAEVVRADSGVYPTDTDLVGLNYKDLLAGNNSIPPRFRVPENFRINIENANDEEILKAVVRLVGQYLRSLDYSRDQRGDYNGSPYDAFLKKNNLPMGPDEGESQSDYSNRLLQLVLKSDHLVFVDSHDGQFTLQQQEFKFTEKELKGMKIFFTEGKCIQCHSAPDFTDHLFHNTGVSQSEYDQVHGAGSFINLEVPTLLARNTHPELYLPPSRQFPNAKSLFRSVPTLDDSRRADLGAWVVFGNPSIPNPQVLLRAAVCRSLKWNCEAATDEEILEGSLGMIKTPAVRDLGQSGPYFHSGVADNIEGILHFYETYSALARAGEVRNADPILKQIRLNKGGEQDLKLFLQSLNEDYN
jgi:cytochrome c peroxidase